MKNKESMELISKMLGLGISTLVGLHDNMITSTSLHDPRAEVATVKRFLQDIKKVADKNIRKHRRNELKDIQNKLGLSDKEFAALREEVK